MAEGRSKRQKNVPNWMYEVEDPDAALAKISGETQAYKYVYRPLTKDDVNSSLRGREVFVHWPDNDTWYRAKIIKVNSSIYTADIEYPDTDELEEGTDLTELITARQIAFKERRPINHICKEDEINVGQEFIPEPRDSDEDVEINDDTDRESMSLSYSESDPSYSSAQEKRRRHSSQHHSDDEDEEEGRQSKIRRKSDPHHHHHNHSRPSSSSKKAGRTSFIDPDNEEEYAEHLLRQATKSHRQQSKQRGSAATHARAETKQSQGPFRAQNMNDNQIRGKVRSAFQQTLDLALSEITAAEGEQATTTTTTAEEEEGGGVPLLKSLNPMSVATAVEDALYREYKGTTKEYKAKTRTLHFNLKDPHNKELRAHVLRGDIDPGDFVRMTATDLASKELSEYRKKKEQESLKMAVLDAEAAAKFSTAAALDAKDKLAVPVELISDKLLSTQDTTMTTTTTLDNTRMHAGNKDAARKNGILSTDTTTNNNKNDDDGGENATTPLRAMPLATKKERNNTINEDVMFNTSKEKLQQQQASINWASIKEQAVHAAHETSLLAPSPLDQTRRDEDHHRDDNTKYMNDDTNRDHYASATENLQRILLPNAAAHEALVHSVWESDIIASPETTFPMIADAIAGCGDLASLLGNTPLTVKGRLALSKLDAFLSELHLSKHRTATLGVLRPSIDATDQERAGIKDLVGQYMQRGRTGVIEPCRGVEVYLVPHCELSKRILESAKNVERVAYTGSILGESTDLKDDMFLVVVIHKKELRAAPGLHRAVKRVRQHGGGQHGGGVPALPAGLDLNAISALASAFGVGPATGHQ